MSTATWILLIYFAIYAIGGLLSRKAQQERESARRGRRPQPDRDPIADEQDRLREDERELAAGGRFEDERPTRPVRQTPEEIAAEIRRVMGLEREEPVLPMAAEAREEPTYEGVTEPAHGGNLHDRIHSREQAGREAAGGLAGRYAGSSIGSRQLGSLAARYATVPAAPLAAGPIEAKSRYIDLSDVARALVTMEVLGPPKALRDDF